MRITSYDFCEEGYEKVMNYEQWRVAVLKYCEELEIQNISSFQKHCETDEVFVLLEGTCTLFEAGDGEHLDDINMVPMEKNKAYNVKKGVWHTHTLEKNTTVLIIENENTCDNNSPVILLDEGERRKLQDLYLSL